MAIAVAVAFAICVGGLQAGHAAAEESGDSGLYRWLDHEGAIRYTRDRSRIPGSRRDTMIKVVRGSMPGSIPILTSRPKPQSTTTIPTPPTPGGLRPPRPAAPRGDGEIASDPFNAPVELRRVTTELPPSSERFGVTSWPELDSRIDELEALIAQDEEIVKEIISTPPTEDYDEVIHSTKLREVAARLPILQGELSELRRWRDPPNEP